MPRIILDWDKKYKTPVLISDFLPSIRAGFSVPNQNKIIMKKLGKPTWYVPDFTSPITEGGRFDIGLYFEILKYLEQNNKINYEIITTDLLQDQLIRSYSWKDTYNISSLNIPLRPYQESGVKRCIHMGYGIIIIGTAGGKTLLMASLVQTIRNNSSPFTTLIILPSNIIEQTYKEFLNYGIDKNLLSMWNGDNEFKKTSIILAGAEILKFNLTTFSERKPIPSWKWKSVIPDETYINYLKEFNLKEKERKKEWLQKRKEILQQLNDVDLLLIDEVHSLRRGNVINKVLDLFSTKHRFGFTGTLPSGLLDQWNIIGNIGPIILNFNSAELRDHKYISQVKTQILNLNYKNPPKFKYSAEDPDKSYKIECDFLYHNEFRNKVIALISNNFDKNSLIMVDRIEHGETLEKILKEQTQKDVYFIRGSVEIEDREKIRALMESNNNIVCIAMSRIFAVGINIKNLHYIIFAQGGKAKVTLIQSIGRGLRLHDQKECLIIMDIADNTHYGKKHLSERITYYEEEQIEYETKELFE